MENQNRTKKCGKNEKWIDRNELYILSNAAAFCAIAAVLYIVYWEVLLLGLI